MRIIQFAGYRCLSMAQNDAPTPVMLSPAISPAATVMANRSVTFGQRTLTSHVSTAPSDIITEVDAGKTNASPNAAARGS